MGSTFEFYVASKNSLKLVRYKVIFLAPINTDVIDTRHMRKLFTLDG